MISALAVATAASGEARPEQTGAATAATTPRAKAQAAKKAKARALQVASVTSVPVASAASAASTNAAPMVGATRPVVTGASSGYGVAPMSAPTAGVAASARTAPADEARNGESANPAASTTENDSPTERPNPNRYVMRFRLDDGRYRGFHQDNPDELRTGEAVQGENDRIRAEHRARGRDLYP
jgi:hypothetical protein